MKKLLSVVLCLIILSSFVCSVFANEKANLILEYSNTPLKAGQTLTAKFIITNNSGFGCVGVHVGFNKSTLELKQVTKTYKPTGNYIDTSYDASAESANIRGKYNLAYVPKTLSPGEYSDPITYNGVFAEFTFVAKKDCIPEIAFVDNYVDFFLDDENLTSLPYNLMINKTNVDANASFDSSTSVNSNINTNVNVDANLSSNTGDIVASKPIISNSSNITGLPNASLNSNTNDNNDFYEHEVQKPTNQNNIDENTNNSQQQGNKQSDNNLTLLIVVLVTAVVLVLAAVLVKKFNKKQ